MVSRSSATKLGPGRAIAPRDLVALSGEAVHIPDADRVVHVQFRRFAGCPVSDLNLGSFVRRRDAIEAASIREVVVFHSSAAELCKYEGDLPFAVIPDPDKHLYVGTRRPWSP